MTIPSTEYSKNFDTLRKNRVAVSFYKYGTAKRNFGEHLINAIETAAMCVEKYKKTGNTEYLCDAANFMMFEFMYPSVEGAYFKPTNSSESAGISGFAIKELEDFKENNDY